MNKLLDPGNDNASSLRRLFLVRHGETAANAAGRFLGRTDPSLNEHGVRQAHDAAAMFRSIGPVEVVSSPARRAVETASLLSGSEPIIEDGFREIDFGDWEGLTQDEVARVDPVNFAAFASGDIAGFPGGESVVEVAERTSAAIAQRTSESLVVVTHATCIRIMVVALLGLPITRYRLLFDRPANLSVTSLESDGENWTLRAYAEEQM